MLSEDEGRQRGNPPAEVEALRAELVRIKEEKNLSLTALAHDSEISRSTWNRVLKGESFPPRKEIERLSRRPRLEAQHLLGLWEAADAALKATAADAASAGAPPTAPDDDVATAPPTTTAPAPAAPDSSTAPVTPAPPSDPADDAPGATARPTSGEPLPSDSPSGRPNTTPAAETTTVVPRVPAAPAQDGPAESAVDAASPSPAVAPAPAAEEIAVVRPVPVPAPATKTGKIAKMLITLLALTVVLLIGRWAAMPDPDKNALGPQTTGPQTTGETQPGATEDAGEGGDPGNEESPQDMPPPADDPTAAGNDDKPQDSPATGPGDLGSPAPGASSGIENTTAPSGRATPDKTPSGSPTPTTTPSTATPTTEPTKAPTTAASLGEEGRTACAHYKPNRRVILAKGMVGTNVAQVQCLLNHNYDYTLPEDGVFGANTEAGVKAVQRCSGITADGKVGPDTWKYLDYPKPACGH
ncbi:peptidoglycan-binding protein [Streptomyces sp. NBC_00572]|uniref:peptidoglycan-binding protein n=1 Tax=Streptomyces sp. NBC_00572 TaxID=2903664 RepID=UPI00224F5019|nr:peptidoglycan-binding protein [Streptomyces sp. NBC_00572]MCX4987030.1 peptidoglycan-binding protein [Streptomyces sp. NBC_00572]